MRKGAPYGLGGKKTGQGLIEALGAGGELRMLEGNGLRARLKRGDFRQYIQVRRGSQLYLVFPPLFLHLTHSSLLASWERSLGNI